MISLNPHHRIRTGQRHFVGELSGNRLTVKAGATFRDDVTLDLIREPKAKLSVRIGNKLIVQSTDLSLVDELGVFAVTGKAGDAIVVELKKGQCRDGKVWVQKMESSARCVR